jgi:hypothetical protein
MQMSLTAYTDSITGQISWQRSDTMFVFGIIGASKAGTDSVTFALQPIFLFISPLYLIGRDSANAMTGTYHALVSSIGLSPTGVWSAIKTR